MVLQGNFDLTRLAKPLKVNNVVERVLPVVDILNQLRNTALIIKRLAVLRIFLVDELERDLRVEISQLAHSALDDVRIVLNFSQNRWVWHPSLRSTGLAIWHGADFLDIVNRNSFLKPLSIQLSVPLNRRLHPSRKRVGTRNANTVQTARSLVTASLAAKLTARVKNRHDDLKRRNAHLLVLINRNAAPVVLNSRGAILEQRHRDVVAVTGESLVNRVVDNLSEKLVKTALAVVSNVHSRSLPNGLKPFQNLNLSRVIIPINSPCEFVHYGVLIQAVCGFKIEFVLWLVAHASWVQIRQKLNLNCTIFVLSPSSDCCTEPGIIGLWIYTPRSCAPSRSEWTPSGRTTWR